MDVDQAGDAPVVDRMQRLIDSWEPPGDRRAIFLACYAMMTRGMLSAIERSEFEDGAWVYTLLHRFADYYFDALNAYDRAQPTTPAVWRLTFDAARRPRLHVLQHLILGVNAHINYDLVFVIHELLHETWPTLPPALAESRYRDHCRVNEVIYRTIDSVQDQIVERYSPAMNLVDVMLLRADEWLLGRLIRGWREQVWADATRLMTCAAADASGVRQDVEARAVQRGQAILLQRGLLGLRHLF